MNGFSRVLYRCSVAVLARFFYGRFVRRCCDCVTDVTLRVRGCCVDGGSRWRWLAKHVAVQAFVCKVAKVSERPPHRRVDQAKGVVVHGRPVDIARVNAVPPHETGARLGERIHLVQQVHEAGRLRMVHRVAKSCGVELREVKLHEENLSGVFHGQFDTLP